MSNDSLIPAMASDRVISSVAATDTAQNEDIPHINQTNDSLKSNSTQSATLSVQTDSVPSHTVITSMNTVLASIERMVGDQLKERKRRRYWSIFFRISLLLLLAGFLFATFSDSESALDRSHIALIRIEGSIGSAGDTNAAEVVHALQRAHKNKNVKAILLAINSPGGSPVDAQQINEEITRLRQLPDHKPVHAVIGDVGASAAYYIAVASDKIYASRASLVGSIGVISMNLGFEQLLKQWGIEPRVATAGKNKAMNSPLLPQSAAQKQHLQSMLNEIHLQFIGAVKSGRGTRLKERPDTFSGLVWVGSQALSLGLIDAYGSIESVMRNQWDGLEWEEYTTDEALPDRLLRQIGVSVGVGVGQQLMSSLQTSNFNWR